MTSSSERRTPRPGFPNVPAPEGSKTASSYTRFIPREELGPVQAWQPGTFGAVRPRSAREDQKPAEPTEQEWLARVEAARHQGYEDGYRDGLVALEGFKKSHSAQVSARVGQLVQSFDAQWAQMEQHMAQTVARSAVLLARQVLRSELSADPRLVSAVAREAMNTVLMSARQIVVRVHPEDLPLVAEGAGDALQARGARLQADGSVQRGGCKVDSDAGTIDATIEARWSQAAQSLGHELPWEAPQSQALTQALAQSGQPTPGALPDLS